MLAAQLNLGFIKHLEDNNLYTEYTAYLRNLSSTTDSVNYASARYHLHYRNDSLFVRHFNLSKTLCVKDSLLMRQAAWLMLNSKQEMLAKAWFRDAEEWQNQAGVKQALLVYEACLNPDKIEAGHFNGNLQHSFIRYRKIMHKKPLVAAGLSLVLPGAGKVYGGKTRSGLAAFFLNASYAAQTWESHAKLGIRHPLTVFNAAMFGVFYFSNIYGSYSGILQLRKERKKQFIHDAAIYYQ